MMHPEKRCYAVPVDAPLDIFAHYLRDQALTGYRYDYESMVADSSENYHANTLAYHEPTGVAVQLTRDAAVYTIAAPTRIKGFSNESTPVVNFWCKHVLLSFRDPVSREPIDKVNTNLEDEVLRLLLGEARKIWVSPVVLEAGRRFHTNHYRVITDESWKNELIVLPHSVQSICENRFHLLDSFRRLPIVGL